MAASTRGAIRLQPNYFSSSIYVQALRADISTLIFQFHERYNADKSSPFTLFKSLWAAQGWKWLHFRVFDSRTRETFLDVTMRLFLERTVKTEAPFTRVVALFALYTFFNTQPTKSAPPLSALSQIPAPIDHYNNLLGLPSTLTSPFLAPLEPFVSFVLSSMVDAHAFHLLPSSELGSLYPRDLPREIFVEEGLIDSNQPQRKVQYSKREKLIKARAALEELDQRLGQPTATAMPSGAAYARQKALLLEQIGVDDGALGVASESVATRLRDASGEEGDVEGWDGMARMQAASRIPGGMLALYEP